MSKDSSDKYYQDNKLQKRLQKTYQEDYKKRLMKDIEVFPKKKKKEEYGHELYKNLLEDEKSLVEYRKNYYKVRKNASP